MVVLLELYPPSLGFDLLQRLLLGLDLHGESCARLDLALNALCEELHQAPAPERDSEKEAQAGH